MRKTFILCLLAGAACLGCSHKQKLDERPVVDPGGTEHQGVPYTNPVIKANCPDPSIFDDRERTGYIYAYSTQNGANGSATVVYLPVYRSKDMVAWELVGNAFGGMNRPTWGQDVTRVWAPDINYIGGQYVLYYALGHLEHSELGTSGVAVSDSPTGPFRDLGIIVSLENTGVSNSIDPNYFEDDDGSKYLFWGSYGAASGIWVVDLTDDGLAIRPGSEPVKVAGNNMEGTMVHKHGGYYYLFASMGNSFAGGESTYRVVIGRSTSVKGPYTGPNGWSMINDTYSRQQADGSFTNTIMEGYDAYGAFVGTGHNSEILTDDNGEDWMCMHARWSGDNYAARPMILERVYWNAEWPYFKTGRPTISGTGPYFKASD